MSVGVGRFGIVGVLLLEGVGVEEICNIGVGEAGTGGEGVTDCGSWQEVSIMSPTRKAYKVFIQFSPEILVNKSSVRNTQARFGTLGRPGEENPGDINYKTIGRKSICDNNNIQAF
jgi:hypothetical protein